MRNILVCGLLIAGAALFGCGKTEKPRDSFKIGVAGPMTGGQAKYGTDMMNGVEIAVEEWNAKGGVLGKDVVLLKRDDEAKEQQAQSVALDLVNEGVVGVIGHLNSGCTVPATEVYHKKMIPCITPSSTSPRITERKDEKTGEYYKNVFRVCGRDDDQGGVAANFAANTLKVKRVAVIHDKTQYGQGFADEFKKALEGKAEVVWYGGFPKEEQNFKPIISAIKETNPDLCFFGGMYDQAGPLIVQSRESGLTAPFMSGDGMKDDTFIKAAGAAAEGSLCTFAPDPQNIPTAKTFMEKYKQKYKMDVGAYSVYGYVAADIILSSIQKAGVLDTLKICEQIRANKYDGALGQITFDEKGDIIGSFFIVWVVKDGKFVPYQ